MAGMSNKLKELQGEQGKKILKRPGRENRVLLKVNGK